jgi:hypothetical protein
LEKGELDLMGEQYGWAHVRVDKYLDGANVGLGVPVRFHPVIDLPEAEADRRADRKRKAVTAVVPISGNPTNTRWVRLETGAYDIEAVLPSGELLTAEQTIEPEGDHEVVLRGESSPNEWRSWAHFAGANLASAERKREESLPDAYLESVPELEVTVGSTAHEAGTLGGFDPSRWGDWFDFLQANFERRDQPVATHLSLSGNDSGLEVQREGGYDGLPLRISLVQREQVGFRAQQIGKDRLFLAVSGVYGSRLFMMPWPWGESSTVPGAKLFDIMAVADRGHFRCDPVLVDERWGGLLAYVNSGRIQLAAEIVQQASDALFQKFENPLAAVVGGYVLLSTDADQGKDRWPDWLDNLARRFPELPDGAILRARWLLNQGGEKNIEQAHNLLYESVERGLPYFTTGVVWLIEGMEQTSIGCDICTDLLARIRGIARSMDLSQAFTSFAIAKPEARRGSLPIRESDVPWGNSEVEPTYQTLLEQLEKAREVGNERLPTLQYLSLTSH